MEIAAAIIERNFDKAMLDQIDTLRTIRLTMAESMMKNLEGTAAELATRGLAIGVTADELRVELTERINTLRERLQRPDVIFSDEIDLYVDLIENDLDSELAE